MADVSLPKPVKTYITVRNGARYVCRTFVTYRAHLSLKWGNLVTTRLMNLTFMRA